MTEQQPHNTKQRREPPPDRIVTTIRPIRNLWEEMQQVCTVYNVTATEAVETGIRLWMREVTKGRGKTLLLATPSRISSRDIDILYEYLEAWKREIKRTAVLLDEIDIEMLLRKSKKQGEPDKR